MSPNSNTKAQRVNSGEFEALNFTQVPNKLFSLIPYMSDAELRVTLIIVRETLGWHKEWSRGSREHSGREDLSTAALMRRTGLSKPTVQKGIKEGIKRGTIERREARSSFVYRLKVRAMSVPNSDSSNDEMVFDEEAPADKSKAISDKAKQVEERQKFYQGKDFAEQGYYPPLSNKLSYTGQESLPQGGKIFALHEEEIKETKKQTPTNKQAPASPTLAPVVVCVRSRFSLDECRRYAEHLASTGQGIKNPGGYATSIYRSGQMDAQIELFKRHKEIGKNSPSTPLRSIDAPPPPKWRFVWYAEMQRLLDAEPDQNRKGDWSLLIADLPTFSSYEEFRARFSKLISEQENSRDNIAV